MSKNQQRALLSVVAILAAMLLFPPYIARIPDGTAFNRGFAFIARPPCSMCVVNTTQLLVQVLVVAIAGVFLLQLLKRR